MRPKVLRNGNEGFCHRRAGPYVDPTGAKMVAQIFPRWNRVADWLRDAERFSVAG